MTFVSWSQVPTHFDEADPIVDVGVAGLHFTDFKTSRELEDFIQQQPDWVFTIPFLGVYDSWIFWETSDGAVSFCPSVTEDFTRRMINWVGQDGETSK